MEAVSCVFAFEGAIRAHFSCAEHSHPCAELVLNYGCRGAILAGSGWRGRYDDGTVFVYQPGDTHWVVNETAGSQLCVGLEGPGVAALGVAAIPFTDGIAAVGERFRAELKEGRPDKDGCLDLLGALLVLEVGRALRDGEARPPSVAERARRLIDAGFREEGMSVRKVAARLHVTPDYLRQTFKAAHGEAPLGYLLRRRVEHATKLLRNSGLTVKDVAAECGFNSQYYFGRLFKRLAGAPPGALRQSPDSGAKSPDSLENAPKRQY